MYLIKKVNLLTINLSYLITFVIINNNCKSLFNVAKKFISK